MKDDSVKSKSGAELRAQRARRGVAAMSTREQQLEQYRAVIVRRQRDFVETGTALGLIAKEGLFREAGYDSFEAMVQDEFDMSTSTAYRLVDAARVVTILSQVGTIESRITNQSQALALAPLVKDRDAMVLTITAAEARAGRLTADLLTAVRVELYPHTEVIDGEVVPEKSALVSGMRQAIEQAAAKTAEPMPVEIYRCEKCTKPLAEGIVKAAQRRCLGCDPNREHAAYEVGGPCMVCPKPCENCDGTVKATDVPAGHLRCRACDPTSLHRAVVVDDEFTDACTECVNEAATAARLAAASSANETSAAVTAANTGGVFPPVGEPDVDEEAASTSGTTDSGENSSDGEDAQPRVDAPVGSESVRTGLGSGELQDGIEEGIGCDRCDFSLLVSSVDPDASLTEMRYHLRREHDLYGDAAGLALARVRTISPAADTSDTESQVVLQQPGPDSPTGREGGRSELDHHRAGVSGGEAPESPDLSRLPVGELEDGGQRALTPSSSDPREEPTAADRLLHALDVLVELLDQMDPESMGPYLFPAELVQLHQRADRIAEFVGRIGLARSGLLHTP